MTYKVQAKALMNGFAVILAIVLAVGVLIGVKPTPAQAATTAPVTTVWSKVTIDTASHWQRQIKKSNGVILVDDVTAASKRLGTTKPVSGTVSAAAASWGGGPARWQGCSDVTFTYHRYNQYFLTKSTIYKFKLHVYWCFGPGDHIRRHKSSSGKWVASVQKSAWFSNLAPGSAPIGAQAWQGYWKPYNSSRNWDSGWHIRVQQGWRQCVFTKYLPCSTEYPRIDVDIYGDGIWRFDAGR